MLSKSEKRLVISFRRLDIELYEELINHAKKLKLPFTTYISILLQKEVADLQKPISDNLKRERNDIKLTLPKNDPTLFKKIKLYAKTEGVTASYFCRSLLKKSDKKI